MIDFTDSDPIPLGTTGVVPKEVDWFPSDDPHGAAVFASLPGYERTHILVSHGSKVSVYDVGESIDYWDPITFEYCHLYEHVQTVNVGTLLGVPDLQVSRVAAGRWTIVEAAPGQMFAQAALYVVGKRVGADEAYYGVLDQQWLIEQTLPPGGDYVYDSGPICSSPTDCTVMKVFDLRVGDLGDPVEGYTEEAYINVLQDVDNVKYQTTFRLERGFSSTDFTLISEFDDLWGLPYAPDFSGIGFAPDSHDVYVPLKTKPAVLDMVGGGYSCELDSEPVDVAVWEPGVGPVSRYLLALTWDGAVGELQIFPADADPDDQCSDLAQATKMTFSAQPTSIDIFPKGNDRFWALVVTGPDAVGDTSFKAIRFRIDPQTGGFDAYSPITRNHTMSTSHFSGSCPSYVHFGLRDRLYNSPIPQPLLDRECLPQDPRCR